MRGALCLRWSRLRRSRLRRSCLRPSCLRLLSLSAWLVLGAACGDPAPAGETCTDSSDCEDGLRCFEQIQADGDPLAVCMAGCDAETTRRCVDGSACIGAADGEGVPLDEEVCYLGGPTAVGESCTGTLQCEAGAICVIFGAGPEGRCALACFTDADDCDTSCEPLEAMGNRGFCQLP